MIISHRDILVHEQLLHCTIMDPDIEDHTSAGSSSHIKGVCLFTHGQGDYSERYSEVLHPFTERGIRCILFDLPGHGESPGKRGHVGDLVLIDAVIAKGLEMAGNLPVGIAGHSMGGLLTLRHLTLSLQGRLPMPEYCWINAALLSPAENKSTLFVRCVKILAKFYPRLMVKTGTSPELCRTPNADAYQGSSADSQNKKSGCHQSISVKWGLELIKAADFISESLPQLESKIPLLYTQGGTDLICPDHIAEAFFAKLPFTNKTYKLFPKMRHETFAEPERELLFATVGEWLDLHL